MRHATAARTRHPRTHRLIPLSCNTNGDLVIFDNDLNPLQELIKSAPTAIASIFAKVLPFQQTRHVSDNLNECTLTRSYNAS